MLTTRIMPTAYVDPFDRICHGFGITPATTDSKEAKSSLPDLGAILRVFLRD